MRTLVIAAALGCGAMGGVFFAFSTFIMAGLKRLPAPEGIRAMQSINVTAVRPAFMALLFGTAALCVLVAIRAVMTWGDRRALLLLAGAAVYLLGAIVLTAAYNVPRNDALAALDPSSAGAAAHWVTYVREWTLANHLRTVASLAASLCLILALV
jgi:uncharacterized membrane protein